MAEEIFERPSQDALQTELNRLKHKKRFRILLRSTLYTLITVAAVAVLVATLWTPVLHIFGNSMTPTLREGQYVVAVKGSEFEQGDLVSFYIGNKLLVKRVIALPGDWVDIREDGTVYINGEALTEPYVSEKSFGQCDLEMPFQVPQERYFLMGDHRETSVDSRSSVVGCVGADQIVGKVIFRVWPLPDFGVIS